MPDHFPLFLFTSRKVRFFLTDGNSSTPVMCRLLHLYFKKCATPKFPLRRACITAKLSMNFGNLDSCITGRRQQGLAMPTGVTWHSMGRHIMCHDSISGQDPVPARSDGYLAGLLCPDTIA